MTILYVHTDKTLNLDNDLLKFLTKCAIRIKKVGKTYKLFAQKICLSEDVMAEVVEILYYAHDEDNLLLYVTPSSHYGELYLNWQ